MPCEDTTYAVFSMGSELILVRLDDDDTQRAAADACGRGYSYAGSIAVIDGEPKVHIEANCTVIMSYAGVVFAGLLGTHLKETRIGA